MDPNKLVSYHQQRQALGSHIQLVLVSAAEEQHINDCFKGLWRELLLFEKRCSRFLQDSELSLFNATAGSIRHVSPEFHDILRATQRMAAQTQDLFNPFILPALQRAGYKQSWVKEHETDAVDDVSGRSMVPSDQLEIGDDWARIPYGTALDLGGCGKGYIGDVLASKIDSWTDITGYWLSIGGDVITGGVDLTNRPITVSIMDCFEVNIVVAQASAPSMPRLAVATSTTLKRQGVYAGKRWHHIIDPRTGLPAETDVVSASICAASLLEADVQASNLIIIGSKESKEYLHAQNISDALLQFAESTTKPRVYGDLITLLPGQKK